MDKLLLNNNKSSHRNEDVLTLDVDIKSEVYITRRYPWLLLLEVPMIQGSLAKRWTFLEVYLFEYAPLRTWLTF